MQRLSGGNPGVEAELSVVLAGFVLYARAPRRPRRGGTEGRGTPGRRDAVTVLAQLRRIHVPRAAAGRTRRRARARGRRSMTLPYCAPASRMATFSTVDGMRMGACVRAIFIGSEDVFVGYRRKTRKAWPTRAPTASSCHVTK